MQKIGAVLVIGGGIGGIQASLDLANTGFKVYLVEESSAIGGKMAQLDKTFPTNDCSICILSPKLLECAQNPNINILTLTKVISVTGTAGNFSVTLQKKPRYVIADKCNNCGLCFEYCPVKIPDIFNQGLNETKCISNLFPQGVPMVPYIQDDRCLFFLRKECKICYPVCESRAIDHYQKEEILKIDVGSIICATGYEIFNPLLQSEYGYKNLANIITSLEFERILSASGPFNGELVRPYDKKYPDKIAWIQCIGSRDESIGNGYCSGVCCMYAIKQAIITKEHNSDTDITIFHNDIRAFGKGFERYYERAKAMGIKFIWSKVSIIDEVSETKNIIIRYRQNGIKIIDSEFDMVVLSVGLRPSIYYKELANILKLQTDKYGFLKNDGLSIVKSSREGIYLCGVCQSPKDIPDSVSMASGAAANISQLLAISRNTLIEPPKKYPEEKDVSIENPNIGVFICHCGTNIAGSINVPNIVNYISTIDGVGHVENTTFACSIDSINHIIDIIKTKNLNRLVIAACTPRTHEPVFQEALKNAGLNPFLLEFSNIREQCSWVHIDENAATEKAKELIYMSILKAKLLQPLPQRSYDINKSALIIGGGISGLVSALNLAEQGFKVHLVEKSEKLGGNALNIYNTLEGYNIQNYVNELIKQVQHNLLINIYTETELNSIEGYIGNFKTTLNASKNRQIVEINHGVIIIATGAQELKPSEYLYGINPSVMTMLELENEIVKYSRKITEARTVVMIQCVGSRNQERPYCSRVCCAHSIKNAIKIKEINHDADIYILYRDIRTYGLKEDYYRKASELGIRFIRYEPEDKPELEIMKQNEQDVLRIYVTDPTLQQKIELEADILALASAIIPQTTNEELSKLLKVSLNEDGFFLEAHMKLRPVDFANDGIFLCGLAHGPKFIEESIAQAQAAACRATSILIKEKIQSGGIVCTIDENKCSGCRICEILCPYRAISFDIDKKVARITEALCTGCGTCAAACPSGACSARGFEKKQILAQIGAISNH